MKPGSTIRVTVLLLEGGLPSTAVVTIDILGSVGVIPCLFNGEAAEPRFRVTTASLDGGTISAPFSLSLTAEKRLDEVGATDLVIIPAVGVDIDRAVEQNRRIVSWVREQYARGAEIAAVCTGVGLLAATGLLDGKPATSHWGVIDAYRKRFPEVQFKPENLITESEGLYCGGGVYSALDLSLYLVERYCGHEVALETARSLVIQPPRIWQSGYAIPEAPFNHGDDRIRDVEAWMQKQYAGDFRFDTLAARFSMSPRSLNRRFRESTGLTPLHYLHALRINAAKRHLETGTKSVNEICYAVGYEDVAFFRKLFIRHTSLTPSDYRKRFGAYWIRSRRPAAGIPETGVASVVRR